MQEDFLPDPRRISIDSKTSQISSSVPIPFDWQNRWLKGPEYDFILKNIDAYCLKFGFLKYDFKTHPVSIYENPINGMIYFVKGNGIGTEFGFPRLGRKKRYRWKKMNFTTDLPKQKPYVTYVVASALRSQEIEDEEDMANFRMHAVVPYRDSEKGEKKEDGYVLCHVRKVGKKKSEDEETEQNEWGEKVNFYKLFAFLHNRSVRRSVIIFPVD